MLQLQVRYTSRYNHITKKKTSHCYIVVIIGILYMINSTAFEAIVSVSTIGAQSCYLVPILLRITIARKAFKPGKVYMGRKKKVDGLVTYSFF